jgi:hypothetical protein
VASAAAFSSLSCLNAARVSGVDRKCMIRESRRRERELAEGLVDSSVGGVVRGGARPGVGGVEHACEVAGRRSMRLFILVYYYS